MDKQSYVQEIGRRKEAAAQVRLIPGAGSIIVNGAPYEQVFPRLAHRQTILKPLTVTETLNKYNVVVKAEGGGVAGQADAISLGLARALVEADASFKGVLRQHHLLTRDARVKERKKPGLKRARKAPQSPKR